MLFNPTFASWYTDTVNVFRVRENVSSNIDRQERKKVNEKPIACRVYSAKKTEPIMQSTGATSRCEDKLSCDIGTDIRAGDELIITRGGNIGKETYTDRYFAGRPHAYYDPVGGVMAGLEHMEIQLLSDEIIG